MMSNKLTQKSADNLSAPISHYHIEKGTPKEYAKVVELSCKAAMENVDPH